MQTQQQQGRPQLNPIFVPQIVWIAILFSVGMLWFLSTQMTLPEGVSAGYETTLPLFAIVAAGSAIASFVLPSFMLKGLIRSRPATSDPAAFARQAFFVPFMIKLALRESIAVLGFVLVASGAPQQIFLYFGSAAAILLMMAKPSIEQIKEIEHQLRISNSTPN